MKQNNIKKAILLTLITLLLIGIASAAEINETTTQETNNNIDNKLIEQSNITNNPETNTIKEIKKQETNKPTKTATQTINVTNFKTLSDKIQYSNGVVNINLKSNIKLNDDILVSGTLTKLTINGNGKTINGQNHQFLDIESNLTTNIKDLKIINCTCEFGGAIINYGKLTITNTSINSNKADDNGGAIYNEGTLTITNSNLNNNKAKYGGAIISYGNLTIKNTTLNSNKASENGGAIYNEGTLTITNSNLKNNKASIGGAIISYGNLTIKNDTLNSNKADDNGGAIHNEGTLKVTQSIFANNQADNGGAIINLDKLTVTNSKFNNNKASMGGAIFIESDAKNIQINSNFTKNHATYGGAIYNNETDNVIIKGTFNYNYANNKYNFVYNNGKNCKITCTPTKYMYSLYGGAIYNTGNKVTINVKSTQKSKIEQLKTNLTINNIPVAYKGNSVTISGKFTDVLGNVLKNTKLSLTINGKKVNTKTDKYGKFTYKYKTTKTGTNKVTIGFAGSTKYFKTSAQKTFTVRTLNKVTFSLKNTQNEAASKSINGDPFCAHYSTKYAQYDPGVYAEIDERGLEKPPVNKIVKATFYFKNSNGKVITKNVNAQYYTMAETSLIKGYTPYKVDVYYTKMTKSERSIWEM